MPIILIGNYPPDRQESMERFTQMLYTGFNKCGISTEIWKPSVFFGKFSKSTNAGVGKWLGYLDKWIVFPIQLRIKSKKRNANNLRFHICDHSNAPYLSQLPPERTAITCHDVLAIRGALGYADAYCPASGPGKLLQKWILKNLSQANKIAFVSRTTLKQFQELASDSAIINKRLRVIYNAFNDDFFPSGGRVSEKILDKTGLKQHTPFLLHVGSDLPRKNRRLLIDMVHSLGTRWNGSICFAGQPADEYLLAHAKSLGLGERIVSVVRPEHETLVALYSNCDAFIFPSFSEGFGWPVIEAQACGAPVIASNIEPMPEVSGAAALHADPANPGDFADAFLSLKDSATRSEIIKRGIQNSNRFDSRQMIKAYLDLHEIKSGN